MVLRVAALLLAVIAAVVCGAMPAAAQDASCVLCTGAKTVACPTCLGKGKGPVACDLCGGDGRVSCPWKLESGSGTTEAVRGTAGMLFHTGSEAGCPNPLCIVGKVTWDDWKSYTCRLCGGDGSVRCARCAEAQTPCGGCGGKGKAEAWCEDCAGAGKIVCLVCANPRSWCRNCNVGGGIACRRCGEKKVAVQPCLDCSGRGTVTCGVCAGLSRKACVYCAGTARARTKYEDQTTASSSKCKVCDEKGVADCGSCEKGRQTCPACSGAKTRADACRACEGGGAVPCRACGVWAFRAEELEAAMLTARNDHGRAVTLLERAVQHATAACAKADAEFSAWLAKNPAPKLSDVDFTAPDPFGQFADYLRKREERSVAAVKAGAKRRRWHGDLARIGKALAKAKAALPKPAPTGPAPPK